MWANTEKNLGKVLEDSYHLIEFNYIGDLETSDIVVSCGCLKPSFNRETGVLQVGFKPGKVPKHLRYKGGFINNKTVNVYSKERGKDILRITATVQMKYYYDKAN